MLCTQSPHGAATCPAIPVSPSIITCVPYNTRNYWHSVELHPTKLRGETAYISMCSVS
jgi:hypothetical protein